MKVVVTKFASIRFSVVLNVLLVVVSFGIKLGDLWRRPTGERATLS